MNSLLGMLGCWCCAPMLCVLLLKPGSSFYSSEGGLRLCLRGFFARLLKDASWHRLVSQCLLYYWRYCLIQYRPYYWRYCVIQFRPYNWCTARQVSCIGGNLPGYASRVRHLNAYASRLQIFCLFVQHSCLEIFFIQHIFF